MRIVICCSADFYKRSNDIDDKLRSMGYEVLVPHTSEIMRQNGDYDVSHYKTWFGNAGDYHKKAALMRGHFDKIAEGDAVLVINDEKHGKPDYIGGNVLMEMALAFHLHKPIYLLNDIPQESAFLEEILGMGPVALHGQLDKLTRA